jgi:hypothetical protein
MIQCFKILSFHFIDVSLLIDVFLCRFATYIFYISFATHPNASGWFRYQFLISHIVNSGIPVFVGMTVCGAVEKANWQGSEAERTQKARTLAWRMCFFAAFGLPLVFTHVLPMAVLYVWVVGPVCLFVALLVISLFAIGHALSCTDVDLTDSSELKAFSSSSSSSQHSDHSRSHTEFRKLVISMLELRTKWLAVIARIAIVFVSVFIFQALVHFGILLYSGDYSYVGVVAREWQMRDSVCYLNNVVSNAKNAFAAITLL